MGGAANSLFEGEPVFLDGLVGFGAVPVPIGGELEDVAHLGPRAVGVSDRHDAELLRGLVRDFAAWAHAGEPHYARVYERWIFGDGGEA